MKLVSGALMATVALFVSTLQQEGGCPTTEETPTPTPSGEVTPTPLPPLPTPEVESRPDSSLGLTSLLRLDSHGHPYTRDASGNIVYDQGVALNTATTSNNFAAVPASVRIDGGTEVDRGEAMIEVAQAYPQVIPLLWCLPGNGSADTAEHFIRDEKFAGLKFHPSIDQYRADSPLLDPYLEVAARYHVPVVFHTAPDAYGSPEQVGVLAARHPSVPVVLFHSGLGSDHQEALAVAQDCSNCYLETSWVVFTDAMMLIDALGSERVIFGADTSIDGPAHYENNWGSGVGNGSYDAQLIAFGVNLPREGYRDFMVNNTLRVFNLVTIHTYRPNATDVSIQFDNNEGSLSAPFRMQLEGGGWWRRLVPSEGALTFRILEGGLETDRQSYTTNEWEVWQKEGALIPPPALTTIRIHADAGYGHSIFVRGSSWPLSWNVGEPATWGANNTWTLQLAGVVTPLEVKALVDDARWETGSNHLVQPGTTVDITPAF